MNKIIKESYMIGLGIWQAYIYLYSLNHFSFSCSVVAVHVKPPLKPQNLHANMCVVIIGIIRPKCRYI